MSFELGFDRGFDLGLDGQRALVTGGTKGAGAAVVSALLGARDQASSFT